MPKECQVYPCYYYINFMYLSHKIFKSQFFKDRECEMAIQNISSNIRVHRVTRSLS